MLNEKLKELRLSKGYTQSDAAKLVNISAPAYSAYESGKSVPPLNTLVIYAQHYGVSLDWLCGLNEHKTELTTLGEVATFLDELNNRNLFRLRVEKVTEKNNNGKQYSFNSYKLYPKNLPFKFSDFLNDYNNLLELLSKNSISKDVFNSWFDTQINELSKIKID